MIYFKWILIIIVLNKFSFCGFNWFIYFCVVLNWIFLFNGVLNFNKVYIFSVFVDWC